MKEKSPVSQQEENVKNEASESTMLWMHRVLFVGFLVLMGVLVVVMVQFSGTDSNQFAFKIWDDDEPVQRKEPKVSDYTATIEARVIDEALKDVSGLTYDPERNTLFTVVSEPAELIELSLDGKILRRIGLKGLGDIEAVTYTRPGHFIVADERIQRLFEIRIDDTTDVIETEHLPQLALSIGLNGNKGFEGLTYDKRAKRLFVAKERNPFRIYEIEGFPVQDQTKPFFFHIKENPERDRRLPVRDISSLEIDPETGHLLVLSDESRRVIEVDSKGEFISNLSFSAGQHGLTKNIKQAEGMAVGADGTLYIVSEPHFFYAFQKKGVKGKTADALVHEGS